MPYPLTGIRVLEGCPSPATQFCCSLLLGLGADVVRAEPPREPPDARRGRDSGATSSDFLDLGTRGGELDLSSQMGRKRLMYLLEWADVLVDGSGTSSGRSGLDAWLFHYASVVDHLVEARDNMVVVRVSWFGSSGPYAGFRGSALVASALSGYMFTNGEPDQAPLNLHGYQVENHAGLQASIAVLMGVMARDIDGEGSLFDISIQETTAFLNGNAELDSFHSGSERLRTGNSLSTMSRGRAYTSVLACYDGNIVVSVLGARDFAKLERLMGTTLAGPNDDIRHRPGAYEPTLGEIIGVWLHPLTRKAAVAKAQAFGLNWEAVNTVAEFLESAQVRERGYLKRVDISEIGQIEVPGRPLIFGDSGWKD